MTTYQKDLARDIVVAMIQGGLINGHDNNERSEGVVKAWEKVTQAIAKTDS